MLEKRFEDLNEAYSPNDQPALLMLHGVTRRWQSFVPLASSLSMRWNVHAIDFRGHGKSARQPGRYQVVDYVQDAVRFIDAQLSSPVLIYGHSLGAMVAAAVAAELGEKVAGIVMEDPPMQTMGRRIAETPLLSFFSAMQPLASSNRSVTELTRSLADVSLNDPIHKTTTRLGDVRDSASLRFTASCLTQLDPEVLAPIVAGQWLEGFETESILRRVQCPALLIQADTNSGGMLRDDDAELIESLAKDVTRVKVNSCGHLVHWSRTTELLNFVHAFFESLELSSR